MPIAERRRDTTWSADPFATRCATCELPITSHPEWDDGAAFCCAGCVAGGPCICTRDASADQRWYPGGRPSSSGWPIDGRVMFDLLARTDRLSREASAVDDPDLHRQIDVLRRHGSALWVTFDPEVAAVGRRVTIQDEDQRTDSFRLALPGHEHATAATLSIGSGAGRALAALGLEMSCMSRRTDGGAGPP
jgi:hypothetical protein